MRCPVCGFAALTARQCNEPRYVRRGFVRQEFGRTADFTIHRLARMTLHSSKQDERWLVTGASGLFGHVLCGRLREAGKSVVALGRRHAVGVAGICDASVDLTDLAALEPAVSGWAPDVVLHMAGLTSVDACEADPGLADLLHRQATEVLAGWAALHDKSFVYISTDHLWDGTVPMVTETTPPAPMNVYARSKLAGETAALAAMDSALVIRTNFFGPGRPWRSSLSEWVLAALRENRPITAFSDVYFTPISTPLLADALLSLVSAGGAGVFHVAGGERLSKYDFATTVADVYGYPQANIAAASIDSAGLRAPRPKDMSLSTDKAAAFLGYVMPDVRTSLNAARKHEATP